ncbi:hypothetical protein Hanom_Chr11g01023311 [Helianthus anomalus]
MLFIALKHLRNCGGVLHTDMQWLKLICHHTDDIWMWWLLSRKKMIMIASIFFVGLNLHFGSYKAGLEELVILKKLVAANLEDRRQCVRFLYSFKYRSLVFESLHMNLLCEVWS